MIDVSYVYIDAEPDIHFYNYFAFIPLFTKYFIQTKLNGFSKIIVFKPQSSSSITWPRSHMYSIFLSSDGRVLLVTLSPSYYLYMPVNQTRAVGIIGNTSSSWQGVRKWVIHTSAWLQAARNSPQVILGRVEQHGDWLQSVRKQRCQQVGVGVCKMT